MALEILDAMLDRLERLVVRNDRTSARNTELLSDRSSACAKVAALERELGLERTKREQAERLVAAADANKAVLRIDLKAAERQRDLLHEAAKAFLEVPTWRRSIGSVQIAARKVLADAVQTVTTETEIPF